MHTARRVRLVNGWEFFPIVVLVAVKFGFHLFANGGYGFLRDELAYIDDGKRLAFGYVDHPPLAPAFAAVAGAVWGDDSLLGLRLWPAICSSLLLGLTMLMAREFGGGRWAMLLAGLAFLGAPIFLASGVLFQTVTFDLLWWGLASWSFVRLIRSDDERWWLALGVFVGLGLLTKYTTVIYVAAFATALLVAPERRRLVSPYPWAAFAVAATLALPNVAWQFANDLVALDYTSAISDRDQSIGRTDDFFPEQLLLLGPAAALIWGAGFFWLVRAKGDDGPLRVLGWTFLFTIAAFAILQGRGYYTAAVYPPLLAAGGVAITSLSRATVRRWVVPGLAVVLTVGAAFAASVSTPVAPAGSAYFEFAAGLNEDLPEMVGWPELVATVAAVRDTLPVEERASLAVLAANYGVAGAVNLYGPEHGLPEAISPVNTYHRWSRDRLAASTYLLVGYSEAAVRDLCRRYEAAAVVTNRDGVENEEAGGQVFICREMHRPLAEIWDALRRFG